MAFAFKGLGGIASSATANQFTLSHPIATTSGAIGDLAVLIVAVDNFQTTDGDEGAVTSVQALQDFGSQNLTKAAEFCNGQGAAQAGTTCSVWYAVLTGAMTAGAAGVQLNISFSNNTARDVSASSLAFFTVGAGSTVSVEGTPATLANDGAAAGSLNVTTSNIECLRIRATSSESNSSTVWTKTAAFNGLFAVAFTASGGATANQGVRGEYAITTGTSLASAPTGGAGAVDNASVYVAFKEVTSAKTLAASAGSYALAGTAATLKLGRVNTATAGSYALTGTAATLKKGYPLPAAAGSYSVTGTAATLRRARLLSAVSGSYNITGTAANLKHGYAVVAGLGSYSVAGTAATLKHGFVVSAGVGSYTLSGAAASLLHGWKVAATAGSYSLAGADAVLTKASSKSVSASAGAYSLTGTPASTLHAWRISAAAGSYSVTGSTVNLKRASKASALAGAYTLTGAGAGLLHGWRVSGGLGSYSISGSDALITITSGKFVAAGLGSYLVTGTAANPRHGWLLAAASGGYLLSGSAAALLRGYAFVSGVGSYVVTGSAATLTKTSALTLAAGTGNYTISGAGASLIMARRLSAGIGAYEITGSPAALVRLTGVSGTLAAVEAGSDTALFTGAQPKAALPGYRRRPPLRPFYRELKKLLLPEKKQLPEIVGRLAAFETGSDSASFTGNVEIAGRLAAREVGGDSASASGYLSWDTENEEIAIAMKIYEMAA